MKRSLHFLVTAGTLLFALMPAAKSTEPNWYLAADFGYTRFDSTSSYSQPTGATAVNSESGGGYRIGGGYRFNEYFSLEANYIDAGHTDIGPDAILPKFGNQAKYLRTRGVAFDAIGNFPLTDRISLYARGGYLKATIVRKFYNNGSTLPTSPDISTHESSFGIGFGVAWRFDDHWLIRTQWQRYYGIGNADIAARGDLDITTLGVEYDY